MNKKMISVIVPAYNCEATIERCLLSVAAQDCSAEVDIQVVVVDDGSTDGTPEICGRIAERDPRFILVQKHNGGVSSARNLGLQFAEGAYVSFLDADDEYEPSFISTLLNVATTTGADLIECAFYQEFPKQVEARNETGAMETLSRHEAICCFALEDRISPNVWSKLFRIDLIGGLRFNEGMKIAEDRDFIFRYLRRCNKVVHVGNCLYRYRYLATSAMHRGYGAELFDSIQFAEDFSSWGCKVYPGESNIFLAQELRNKCRVISLYLKDNGGSRVFPKELVPVMRRVRVIPAGVMFALPPKHALLCAAVKYARPILPLLTKLSGRGK